MKILKRILITLTLISVIILKGYSQEPVKPNFFDIKERWEDKLRSIDSLADENGDYDYEKEDGQRAKFNRWKYNWRYRIGLDGDMTTAGLEMNKYIQEQFGSIQMRDDCDSPLDDAIQWTNLGPFDSKGAKKGAKNCYNGGMDNQQNQGRVDAISVNPEKENDILIGAHNGGIWRSEDGGVTWDITTDEDGFSLYGVVSFVRHTINKDIIYAVTSVNGGNWESDRFNYSGGVIRSMNGGESWEKTGLSYNTLNGVWENSELGNIAIDPNSTINNTILYVVSPSSVLKFQGPASNNNTWTKIYENLDQTWGQLWNGYVNNNDVLVSTGGTVWFSNYLGLWKYDGSGDAVLVDYDIPQFGIPIRQNINIETNDQEHLLMLNAYTAPGDFVEVYIYTSFDNGVTWTDPVILNQAYYNASSSYPIFAVHVKNSDTIFTENGSSSRCAIKYVFDNGNWVLHSMDNTVNHVDVRACETYKINDKNTVFIGTDGGISKTINDDLWVDITGLGLSITNYYGCGITESNDQMIFAGAQDGSINYFIDGSWFETNPSGDNGDCLIYPKDSKIIIQENAGNSKGGSVWQGLLSNNDVSRIASFGVSGFMSPLCWNQANEDEYFIGANSIWLGSISSANINNISDGFLAPGKQISSVATSRSNQDIVYFSTDRYNWGNDNSSSPKDDGIFKLVRTSNSWGTPIEITNNLIQLLNEESGKPINEPGLKAPITDITVDPDDANRIWISVGGFIKNAHVFYSSNGGTLWENISKNLDLPNLPATAISFQEGSDHLVYVGTDAGVYFHNAKDDCWSKYGIKGPPCMINDMEINQCAGKLVVATHGRGLWQAPLVEFDKPIRCCVVGEDIHIWADKTYDEDKWIPGNIIVHTGAKVTVTATLKFNKDKSFVFMRGSKLHLDGGTLTKCEFVDDWQGVKVEGNSAKEQPNYTDMPAADEAGIIYLTNGATIEWARTAISTNYFGQWTDQKWGGLVHCEDSYFLNNYRCVEFMKYKKKNKSKFENCVFDGNSTIEGITKGVTIWETDNIKFEQCTLRNMEAHAIFHGIQDLL